MAVKKHEVDLLIVEDNDVFMHLLEQELNQCLIQKQIRYKFKVNIHNFLDSDDCVRSIREDQSNNDTIAFIDYNFGNITNGVYMLKVLNQNKKNLQVIMMSKSLLLRNRMHYLFDENNNIHFIVKDESTPAMCRIFLENYLENLS